jgi:DNA replication protein DnaC
MTTPPTTPADPQALRERLRQLGFYGLLEHWDAVHGAGWLPELVVWEQSERQRRSLERRLRNARLGRFKLLADFDWAWPKKLDREQIEDLLNLRFLEERANVILVGPNGVGKTLLAKNLAYQALRAGHSVRFVTASEMLNDLAAQDSASALEKRLHRYLQPALLVCDELGYLAYGPHHADLLFEVVSRRYGEKPLLLTTNRPFAEWNQTFPNASCVVTLVDRLVHNAEIVQIQGDSYRLKEGQEKAAERARQRDARRSGAARAKSRA